MSDLSDNLLLAWYSYRRPDLSFAYPCICILNRIYKVNNICKYVVEMNDLFIMTSRVMGAAEYSGQAPLVEPLYRSMFCNKQFYSPDNLTNPPPPKKNHNFLFIPVSPDLYTGYFTPNFKFTFVI